MTLPTSNPAANAGLSYISGFMLEYVDTDKISVSPGQLRDSTNTNDIFMGKSMEISKFKKGAGGVDTGDAIGLSIYAVYVIADSFQQEPTSCLISLDKVKPVLPGGYNMYRRIGFIYMNFPVNIFPFRQVGGQNSTERRMCFDDIEVSLAGGTALVWTAIDLEPFIPLKKCMVDGMIAIAPAAPGDLLHYRPLGSQSALGAQQITGVVAGVLQREVVQFPIDNFGFEYYVEAAPGFAEFYLTGYLDSL